MTKYKAPKHLKDMGARYEHVHRPESPVELRHSLGYLMVNYDAVHLAFPVSGDNLALMRAGEQRWPLPQPEHLKKKARDSDG